MSRRTHSKYSRKIRHKDIKYKLFYGIPHAHSAFSTGKGSPLEAYRYARKKNLHYLILTDHAPFLRQNILIKGNKTTKWDELKQSANRVNQRHKYFTALYGFECKIKSVGDINIYNSDSLPEHQFKGIDQFLKWIMQDTCRIGCINHPHGAINQLLKYPKLNEYLTVMEVGNGSYPNKYIRYYSKFFHFLDNGWKLGAVIGQDNHKDNWGDDESLTVVLAENSSPNSIINAYKNRRTYASESKSLKIIFKINSALMGEILSHSLDGQLNFSILVEDNRYPIEKLEIVTNDSYIIKSEMFNNLSKIDYHYSHKPLSNESWYSVIIYQTQNKQALTSPIFINKKSL